MDLRDLGDELRLDVRLCRGKRFAIQYLHQLFPFPRLLQQPLQRGTGLDVRRIQRGHRPPGLDGALDFLEPGFADTGNFPQTHLARVHGEPRSPGGAQQQVLELREVPLLAVVNLEKGKRLRIARVQAEDLAVICGRLIDIASGDRFLGRGGQLGDARDAVALGPGPRRRGGPHAVARLGGLQPYVEPVRGNRPLATTFRRFRLAPRRRWRKTGGSVEPLEHFGRLPVALFGYRLQADDGILELSRRPVSLGQAQPPAVELRTLLGRGNIGHPVDGKDVRSSGSLGDLLQQIYRSVVIGGVPERGLEILHRSVIRDRLGDPIEQFGGAPVVGRRGLLVPGLCPLEQMGRQVVHDLDVSGNRCRRLAQGLDGSLRVAEMLGLQPSQLDQQPGFAFAILLAVGLQIVEPASLLQVARAEDDLPGLVDGDQQAGIQLGGALVVAERLLRPTQMLVQYLAEPEMQQPQIARIGLDRAQHADVVDEKAGQLLMLAAAL